MADYSELKRLAEAATSGPWAAGEEHESASFQGYTVGDSEGWIAVCGTANEDGRNADFIAAANPAAVLALIAENEQLRGGGQLLVRDRDDLCIERDQLEAEVEALRKDADRYRWLRANTGSGPNIQVSEWVGPHEYPLHTDELDVAIDAAISEEAGHD